VQRAEAWEALMPKVTRDGAAIDAARERVSAVARKAEARARAASGAARARGTAGGSVVGGAPDGSASTGGMSYGDEAPIPSAAEL
jgi:hypothetical protein